VPAQPEHVSRSIVSTSANIPKEKKQKEKENHPGKMADRALDKTISVVRANPLATGIITTALISLAWSVCLVPTLKGY
jgi:hypothetical protein